MIILGWGGVAICGISCRETGDELTFKKLNAERQRERERERESERERERKREMSIY
jgi:hypothetical protein